MRYIQYADSIMVDGHQITSIKGFTAGVLNEVGHKGLASPTWIQSGCDICEHVYFEICAKFPEMGLCADDWKCQRMLIDMYSSWYTGFVGTDNKGKRQHSTIPKDSGTSKRVKIKAAEAPQNPADPDHEMAPTSSSQVLLTQDESSNTEPPKIPFKVHTFPDFVLPSI
ncbi:hypothetical protein C8R44DRAFT_892952 [Mycena epipterygia]|nr:hypothetical protein C8R44DRAFT_892952 [Mycena epipterygia]